MREKAEGDGSQNETSWREGRFPWQPGRGLRHVGPRGKCVRAWALVAERLGLGTSVAGGGPFAPLGPLVSFTAGSPPPACAVRGIARGPPGPGPRQRR
ncbi:hypothetical protein Y1Q_0002906 [Alligator mississippiensis]|uniref:Uncharacterized protein n=1 Tax=Alligator mississippiensis TaxID=8496 RepID=A0A151MCP8_ALLMI|nr:hypothetical protein Y1Q_0002906 [Alligator mississippiensis]